MFTCHLRDIFSIESIKFFPLGNLTALNIYYSVLISGECDIKHFALFLSLTAYFNMSK